MTPHTKESTNRPPGISTKQASTDQATSSMEFQLKHHGTRGTTQSSDRAYDSSIDMGGRTGLGGSSEEHLRDLEAQDRENDTHKSAMVTAEARPVDGTAHGLQVLKALI